MKIQKVEKLNHARYKNFTWNSSIQPFSDGVNILFGWNGSGKTTLSKVFRKIEINESFSDCTFKIKIDSATYSETDSLGYINTKLRVFNNDYIEHTLKGSSTLPYIFFAGKEAVDYSVEEENLNAKKKVLQAIKLPETHNQIAKNTGQLIKEITGMNGYKKELIGGSTYSNYDKSDFEKRFRSIQEKIANGELPDHTSLVRADIDVLKNQLVNNDRVLKNSNAISCAAKWLVENIDNINFVLDSTPSQEISERIKLLPENEYAWVKQGVSLHFSEDKMHENCIFCNSTIINTNELLKHFSEEVIKTINAVDLYIKEIELHTTELAKLESPTSIQQVNIGKLRSLFDELIPVIREKRNAISDKKKIVEINSEELISMVDTNKFDATAIAYAIETHFVAQQYQAYEQACADLNAEIEKRDTLQKEVDELDEKVRVLKQKAKNTHESASALNTLFKVVFPYRQIEITDNDDQTGYSLKRDGNPCSFTSLSEGEKNFIALAYFIYSINDAQNKLADDGVVVIDDPVSSLDKQAIFQIFSIIATEMKKNTSRQYFLLTHNLDFLGHLKEFYGKAIYENRVRIMCVSATDNGSIIEDINPLLRDHRSDYYYVFTVIYKFKDYCDIKDSYLIVNLLRRWLETFLEFKFSSHGDLQSTLESAYVLAKKQTEKWETPFNADHFAMYRFINHGSHGFPDTESTDESILTNTNIRIQEALQLVKILDLMHYKKLESLVQQG